MHVQKKAEQIKEYDKQQKRIKELKKSGASKKQAETKQKQQMQQHKNKGSKGGKRDERDDEETSVATTNLLAQPKDYIVKFRFPEPPPCQPPILGLHNVTFKYPTAKDPIFVNLEFGIDMDSRIAIVGQSISIHLTWLQLLQKYFILKARKNF